MLSAHVRNFSCMVVAVDLGCPFNRASVTLPLFNQKLELASFPIQTFISKFVVFKFKL